MPGSRGYFDQLGTTLLGVSSCPPAVSSEPEKASKLYGKRFLSYRCQLPGLKEFSYLYWHSLYTYAQQQFARNTEHLVPCSPMEQL
jgi:hypothetical protein